MKKCPNIKKRPLFPKYACPFFQEQVPKMSFSPMSHRQPLAMGSSRGGAPRKCRGGSGRGAAPPRMIHLYYYFILQYFQIHRLYQNAWSFSISRFTGPQNAWSFSTSRFRGPQNAWSFSISRKAGYIKMLGPSVFPEKQVEKSDLRLKIDFLGLISSPKRLLNIF